MEIDQSETRHSLDRTGLIARWQERVLRQEVGAFLSQFHWQVFTTLTFGSPCTSAAAQAAIVEWLAKLGPDVYAYIGYEKGPAGGRTHCHALVGGLFQGSRNGAGLELQAEVLTTVKKSWPFGNVEVLPYNPKRGAAWYVAKYPNDGEVIGVMKRHKPHRKRRRREGSHK